MYIKDRMNKNVTTANISLSSSKTLQLMKDSKHSHLPVIDDENRPIGIINQRDLETTNFLLNKTKLSDVMQSGCLTINENLLIEECALKMKENKVGFLPVVNNEGKLTGVISSYDVLKGFMKMLDIQGENVRAIIKSNDIPAISAVLSSATISSIITDNDTSIVKFSTENVQEVKKALEEKFDVVYFKEY